MLTQIAEAVEWQEQGLALIGQAEEIRITDQESLDSAAAFLAGIRALQQKIRNTMDPLCKSADEHHKLLTSTRAALLERPAQAERIIKAELVAHEQRQRRAREIAEQELRERVRKDAETRQLEMAAQAEREGNIEKAERIITGPPPPVLVPPAPPRVVLKTAGVTYRETWSAKVTNFRALVDAVAVGQVPLDLLLPNQQALDALARASKGKLQLPGVEAESTLGAAGRSNG